jgi:transcriptional regulator with XRE-family HTH domain
MLLTYAQFISINALTGCKRRFRIVHMKDGRLQLKDWIHRRVFMQREAAAYLGIDQTFLSQLVNGKRQPGLTNAVNIERLTGIPVEAWVASELGNSDEPVAAVAGNRPDCKA